MASLLVFLVFAALTLHYSDALPDFRHHHEDQENIHFRLCVPDTQMIYCRQMLSARHEGHKITCVSAPDRIGCIDRIIRGDADWTILDPEQLYIAYRYLPTNGLVVISEIRSQEYASRDYRYAPVAVVRSSSNINSISDLRGKRSCHTGFGRNAGWKVPFSHLFTKGELKCTNASLNAVERDLVTFHEYFGPACVPGQWDIEPKVDENLKTKYPELCQLCKDPKACSMVESEGGYDGAVKCLTENEGDVAWTKFDAVRHYFKLNESTPMECASEYQLLCRDGSKMPLTSDEPCTWAKRPWRTVVMTNHLSSNLRLVKQLQEEITSLRQEAQESSNVPMWLTMVLDFNKNTDVEYHFEPRRVKTLTPQNYLRPTNFSETFWHPSCGITEKSLKLCVYNQVEFQKCNALRLAAIGQRISPGFSCVVGTYPGHCSYIVSKGDADLIIVEGSIAEKLENSPRLKQKLVPILREVESTGEPGLTVPFRYALAVIRSEFAEKFQGSLAPLKGSRSCHGSIKSLAGWNVPLSVLRDAAEITGENCNLPVELSNYFAKSCVPGVPEAKRKTPTLPQERLCQVCAGDVDGPGKETETKETVCDDSPNERYQGPFGALQCLTDDVADVAFIDHVGLLQKISSPTKDAIAKFKLLCRNGTVATIENVRSCNWGMIPSQKILARGGEENRILRENARISLIRTSEYFKPGGKDEKVLKLFGEYFGTHNIIFQDTSVGLQNELGEEITGSENKIIKDFNYCKTETSHHPHGRAIDSNEWKPNEQY